MHPYGNIARTYPKEFRDKFLLTERQRESSPLFASPWLRRLSDDVLSAKWVISVDSPSVTSTCNECWGKCQLLFEAK